MLQPDRLRGRGGIDAATEVGCTVSGGLVLRTSGGLLASSRLVEIDAKELTVELQADGLVVSGGPIAELVVRTDVASSVHRVLTARARGEPASFAPRDRAWVELGTGQVTALTLDPTDPRKAPRTTLVGRPRSTMTVWRCPDGWLRLDSAHYVHDLAPERVFAVTALQGKGTFQVHTFEPPLTEADGWLIGYRLALGDAQLEPVGTPAEGHAPARFLGTVAGQAIDAVLAVRAAGVLHLVDATGRTAASVPLPSTEYAYTDRLLLVGAQFELVGVLPETVARWLVRGAVEDESLVELILPSGGQRPVRVVVADGALRLDGAAVMEVANIEPSTVSATQDGSVWKLAVGELTVRGSHRTVARLREQVLASSGRVALARTEWAELYATWHELRTERWLWLVYGVIFLADHLLEHLEQGPDDEAELRRHVGCVLVVGEHARMVRLRLGAAPVALPYALLDEESDWIDLITDGRGEAPLASVRSRVLDTFRAHLHGTLSHLSFALEDVERLVARLDAQTRDGRPEGWGRAVLSPLPSVLPPGAVDEVTDQVSQDASRVLIERLAPQCRASWELLVDVAAVAAVETRSYLLPLWTVLAERDRALGRSFGEPERARLRAALVERILALRAARSVPLDGAGGWTRGDLLDRMQRRMATGPRALVDRLTKGMSES
jgi:hypothetical protein